MMTGLLLLLPILIPVLAAPIGVPILGYVALNQIRRSAGRLYGLELALFDRVQSLHSMELRGFCIGTDAGCRFSDRNCPGPGAKELTVHIPPHAA
jgi:hypothetical protein